MIFKFLADSIIFKFIKISQFKFLVMTEKSSLFVIYLLFIFEADVIWFLSQTSLSAQCRGLSVIFHRDLKVGD